MGRPRHSCRENATHSDEPFRPRVLWRTAFRQNYLMHRRRVPHPSSIARHCTGAGCPTLHSGLLTTARVPHSSDRVLCGRRVGKHTPSTFPVDSDTAGLPACATAQGSRFADSVLQQFLVLKWLPGAPSARAFREQVGRPNKRLTYDTLRPNQPTPASSPLPSNASDDGSGTAEIVVTSPSVTVPNPSSTISRSGMAVSP